MTSVERTGIWLFPEAKAPRLVETIVLAETLGIDEVWLGDEGPAREPFTVLAAAAQATSTIGLGVGITNPYVRHAALTASTALTINELSEGRFRLGVGAGGQLSLGPFQLSAVESVERVEAFLDTARAVCSHQPASDYHPPDISVGSTTEAATMPLYVGGRGPKMNRLASRKADGAFVAGLPPFRYGQVIDWSHETNPIEVALYPSVAFDQPAVERHRPEMIWSLVDAPAPVCRELGVELQQARRAADALQAGDAEAARAIVTDELLAKLMLVGGSIETGRQLAGLVERHRPTSIGLAILQDDLENGIAQAADAFATMRSILNADKVEEEGAP